MTYVRKLDQKDDIDEIILHLQNAKGDYELSPALEEKLNELTYCRDLIRQYGSRAKVTAMLVNERGVTKSKADRLYQDTMFVYNTTQTSHRDFWIDTWMGMYMETRKKALAKGDLKSAAAVESNAAKLIALMTDTKEAEVYAKLKVPVTQIVFDPGLLNVQLEPDWEKKVNFIIKQARERDLSDIPEAEMSDPETDGK